MIKKIGVSLMKGLSDIAEFFRPTETELEIERIRSQAYGHNNYFFM